VWDLLDDLLQGDLSLGNLLVVVVLAILTGLVAFGFTRWDKNLDRRNEERKQKLLPLASESSSDKEGERFLRKLARGPQYHSGPQRWMLRYSSQFGKYELENMAGDLVHNVKIDVVTKDQIPQMITAQTIHLAQLQPRLPVMIPLGAPSRAKDYLLCVRWDDASGVDQMQRFPVDQAARI
jgi:hypothetical protein